ncbi:hypothetical protein [Streptacidiphilus sp. P02-A3a]|uniref:hypothetical protein n=1 Tax=Streptacidiphilus sp. P02-A3a TaxID=2704468 RepID=UPI0015F95814|nr:hypothetical protein [Streptacidiphilus sp. P02-A3a]QMU68338.1 hypothetical protein GXP74_08940 [Streptacidiphilus sp. P02-A3a]
MSARIRRTAFLAAAAVLAAVPGSLGTARAAQAAHPVTAVTAGAACYDGSLQVADRAVGTVQNATRVGQKLDVVIPVRNLDGATRTGTFVDVAVDAAGKNKSAPPTIWWRLDNDPWHLVHFTWVAPTMKGTDPQWQSPDLGLGTFAAHQTRSLVLSTSFGNGSTRGLYTGWESFGTSSCNGMEQGFGAFAVSYRIAQA